MATHLIEEARRLRRVLEVSDSRLQQPLPPIPSTSPTPSYRTLVTSDEESIDPARLEEYILRQVALVAKEEKLKVATSQKEEAKKNLLKAADAYNKAKQEYGRVDLEIKDLLSEIKMEEGRINEFPSRWHNLCSPSALSTEPAPGYTSQITAE